MWDGPGRCGWCLDWADGPGLFNKAGQPVEQAMTNKPVSSSPPWLLHQFLTPGSCPAWVPILTSLVMMDYDVEVWVKETLFFPGCFHRNSNTPNEDAHKPRFPSCVYWACQETMIPLQPWAHPALKFWFLNIVHPWKKSVRHIEEFLIFSCGRICIPEFFPSSLTLCRGHKYIIYYMYNSHCFFSPRAPVLTCIYTQMTHS